jgi:circadian clock protein KaiB
MKKKAAVKLVAKEKVVLQLYVAGMSPKSMSAIENIRQLCDEHLHEAFELEIIDLYKHPEPAHERQIVFSPSLVKQLPLPKKTMVGNFTDTEKVIRGLGITFKE